MKAVFTSLSLLALLSCGTGSEKLPVLGRKEAVEKQVNGKTVYDTVYQQIPDFRFVDQDSNVVTRQTFDGKVYVADFFFTTCPTICPVMKENMLEVYQKYKDDPRVLILSHSIDPVHDSVAVLRDYAARLGIESSKWRLVTGSKQEIYDIGQEHYMVTAMEDSTSPGGFLHSGAFILVDKEKRIRGIYDGTEKAQVSRLTRDIAKLLKEYE